MPTMHLGATTRMEDLEQLKKLIIKLRLKGDVSNKKLLDIIANFATCLELGQAQKDLPANLISDSDVISYLKSKEISYKFLLDTDYPENLKVLPNPPAIIFYKGDWRKEIFYKTISIVGSRTPTNYGKQITKDFSKSLASQGFTIISGMAFGIDRDAHLGALEVGGNTIAVLASAPNEPTPSNNIGVYNRILDNGGIVISDVLPGAELRKGSFIARNRIVAALSEATLVIEAGEKSGSLITAELAKKYKRHVFAIPGNINSNMSSGTNQLIKNGKARLISKIDDILDAMNINENLTLFGNQILEDLTDKEINIYNALENSMNLEEISYINKSDISDTLTLISSLELKGYVELTDEGKYKNIAKLTK